MFARVCTDVVMCYVRVYYRTKDWHYYLLEFCYVAIALGVINTAFMPTNVTLYKV